MTIAACYLSPEGVVFAADSTATYTYPNGQDHHFNFAQKLFEVGSNSTLGMVAWGLGGLSVGSYRTLIARLADDLKVNRPNGVADVSSRWTQAFWAAYSTSLATEIQTCRALSARPPFNPGSQIPGARTLAEEIKLLNMLSSLGAGFCIGGYLTSDHQPQAYQIIIHPLDSNPIPTPLSLGHYFWGIPTLIGRLINGCADELRDSILNSGLWQGNPAQLDALIKQHALAHPINVPIREAIDFTHACLFATIKAMKFSQFSNRCGGPIEIAVITTDRPFRWVLHKPWDAAIREGEPRERRSSEASSAWAAFAE